MNWININTATLDSESFLGAEPSERATWLCLLRYCCGQENGGIIIGARSWKDRKWQQLVRVTIKEVLSSCDLWTWDGDNLTVSFYPTDKETEVQTNRANGAKGGRPPKRNHPVNHPVIESETERFKIAETERKGKERNGMEDNPHTPQAGEGERAGYDPGFWPDPREYPTLATVQGWATAVMAPPDCAAKWHAERVAEGWQTRQGRPLNADTAALRALFATFATAWKANESRNRKPSAPIRPTENSDVNPNRMKEL